MILPLFIHVRSGIHVNKKSNTSNDQEKQRRKLVNLECKTNTDLSKLEERKIIYDLRRMKTLRSNFKKYHETNNERGENCAASNNADQRFGKLFPAESIQQESNER